MKYISLILAILSFAYSFSQPLPDSLFEKAGIPGAQIVYVNNNTTTVYYYGKPQVGEPGKVDAATVFQAASLSKSVLAYIVLRMADRKLIDLDKPLSYYYQYPRIKDDSAAQRITARMVLHHQTGFPNWGYNPMSKQWAGMPLKTNFTPGSFFSYSGEGFMYLQMAVQTILKQSLEQIAITEVFKPLGMKSSSFIWQPAFEKTGAWGHNKKGESTGRTEPFLPAAAYSLLTTAADYNKFLQALATSKGLSANMHRLMLADTVSVQKVDAVLGEAGKHISWGLGIGILHNELGTAIWHWGDNGDFKCFYIAYPAEHRSLVYFSNSENGLDIMPDLLNHYFGRQTWWNVQWLDKEF